MTLFKLIASKEKTVSRNIDLKHAFFDLLKGLQKQNLGSLTPIFVDLYKTDVSVEQKLINIKKLLSLLVTGGVHESASGTLVELFEDAFDLKLDFSRPERENKIIFAKKLFEAQFFGFTQKFLEDTSEGKITKDFLAMVFLAFAHHGISSPRYGQTSDIQERVAKSLLRKIAVALNRDDEVIMRTLKIFSQACFGFTQVMMDFGQPILMDATLKRLENRVFLEHAEPVVRALSFRNAKAEINTAFYFAKHVGAKFSTLSPASKENSVSFFVNILTRPGSTQRVDYDKPTLVYFLDKWMKLFNRYPDIQRYMIENTKLEFLNGMIERRKGKDYLNAIVSKLKVMPDQPLPSSATSGSSANLPFETPTLPSLTTSTIEHSETPSSGMTKEGISETRKPFKKRRVEVVDHLLGV